LVYKTLLLLLLYNYYVAAI